MTLTTDRRKDIETRQTIKKLLNSLESKESKIYWINVLVKQGKLTELRAGQILIENYLM